MKSRTIVVAIAVAIVIASLSVYVIIQRNNDNGGYGHPDINEGLFETRSFDVVDKDTGSWIKGKIFFIDDGGDIMIRVFADIHLAPGDFGGASIAGNEKIRPTEVLTDYGGDFSRGSVFAVPALGWVTIGPDIYGQLPPGMDGSVIVDFIPIKSFDPETEPLSITLAIGSKIFDDGTSHTCLTQETVDIFLNQPVNDELER